MIQVFYSPQSKMVQNAAKKVMKPLLAEKTPLNFVQLDMAEASLQELGDEVSFLPLGEESKVVVAENCLFLMKAPGKKKGKKEDGEADDSAFMEYLRGGDEAISLFMLVYSDALDDPKANKYLKAIIEGGGIVNQVKEFTPEEWLRYIPNYITKKGASIDDAAIKELSARIEGDYARFLTEASKLISYSNGGTITKKDVEALVSKPLEDDSFSLCNAISKGDVNQALSIYKDLKVVNTEPLLLERMVGNQFRFMNQVAFLYENGSREMEIASFLKASPYRVKICCENIRKMGSSAVQEMLEKVYECEYSILSGRVDPDTALTLLILGSRK